MDKKYDYEHEQDIWLEFYTTFNDDNMRHAQNAFDSYGCNEMSAADLHIENLRCFYEIYSRGFSFSEIIKMMPSAKEYGIEFFEKHCGRLAECIEDSVQIDYDGIILDENQNIVD